MKKNYFLFVFVCINLFFVSGIYAQTPAPSVSSPIYYCHGTTATALTATPTDPSATLRWYSALTGGTEFSSAPIPSTTTVANTSYYVSQTIGGLESTPRTRIDVNVVADNGSKILLLRCDASQILAPATIYNAVFFDWTNTTGLPNQYTYSYSVDGAAPVLGNKNNGTNLQVDGLSQGQSVTLTVWHTTYPCDRSSVTCNVACNVFTTPTFTQIAPVCQGNTAPVLPLTSNNGITGTWSSAVNTVTAGTVTYTFTPNAAAFPCANPQTMNITVLPRQTPTFNTIPTTVCQGATAPVLPPNSNNTTPVSGTWSPNAVDTSTLGTTTYTFIPNPGQCVVATPTTVDITVIPNNVNPNFAPIPPICIGSSPAVLNAVSPSGITGTWSPALINTNTVGTTTYTFTPNSNQCANQQALNVTITAKTVTNFAPIAPFCAGDPAPILASISPNGVSGNWFPATVSNNASGSYVFTPAANECATVQTLNVTVNQPVNPGFSDFTICSGTSAPTLDTTSPTGVTGTWDPPTVDEFNSDSYTFTPDAGECATEQTINVTVIPSNTLVDFTWTVTEAFAENQQITVSATAVGGNYLYQLDDGPFQSNPVFEQVASGSHSITVTDEAGCSVPITKDGILVVNFPKYFTPNNDGFNDTWNVSELSSQPQAYIHIFDRYGKFLKQISPNANGWNGSYNGYLLPADDYWFVIHYKENNIDKEFKSHFSLKR